MTLIYTHVLNRGSAGVRSPVDLLVQGGAYADPHRTPRQNPLVGRNLRPYKEIG